MAKQNTVLVRVDPKLAAELKKIQDQMQKDLGVKISSAQASKIFVDERRIKSVGKLKF